MIIIVELAVKTLLVNVKAVHAPEPVVSVGVVILPAGLFKVTEDPDTVALPFDEITGLNPLLTVSPLVTVREPRVPVSVINVNDAVVMTVPSTFGIVIELSCVGLTTEILNKLALPGIANRMGVAPWIVPVNVTDVPMDTSPLKTALPDSVIELKAPMLTISPKFPVVITFPLASAGIVSVFTPVGSTKFNVVSCASAVAPSNIKLPVILPDCVSMSVAASPTTTFPFNAVTPETVSPPDRVPIDSAAVGLPVVRMVPVTAGITSLHAVPELGASTSKDIVYVSPAARLNINAVPLRIRLFTIIESASAFPKVSVLPKLDAPETVKEVMLGRSVKSFRFPVVITTPPVSGSVTVYAVDDGSTAASVVVCDAPLLPSKVM